MANEKETIAGSIKKIEDNLELFYQQKDQEALNAFQGSLNEMMEIVNTLFAYKGENPDFDLDENKITEILKEAMTAMEDKDYILLADVIQYDFIEYINEISENI